MVLMSRAPWCQVQGLWTGVAPVRTSTSLHLLEGFSEPLQNAVFIDDDQAKIFEGDTFDQLVRHDDVDRSGSQLLNDGLACEGF